MIFNQRFIPFLQGCLKNTDYVLFEHFVVHKSHPDNPYNFLVKEKDHQEIVESIQTFSEIGVINCLKKATCTELHIAFVDGVKVQLNIWKQLEASGINYLNTNKVLQKKQRSKSEFYMPNLEHLFEFSILNHFLNGVGLSSKYQSYFEDFHFFVKDGLLDFFNEKYKTHFLNFDQLSDFDNVSKNAIIEELKHIPANDFMRKVNFQWLNWFRVSAN